MSDDRPLLSSPSPTPTELRKKIRPHEFSPRVVEWPSPDSDGWKTERRPQSRHAAILDPPPEALEAWLVWAREEQQKRSDYWPDEERFLKDALEDAQFVCRYVRFRLSILTGDEHHRLEEVRWGYLEYVAEIQVKLSQEKPNQDAQIAPQGGFLDYVTLDQMAACVSRSKRALEKYKTNKKNRLPLPDIDGGGGRADEWLWNNVRPWLEKTFGRNLPEKFFSSFQKQS
jgi:hypothetical protein